MNYEKAWKSLRASIKGLENRFKNKDPKLYAAINRPDDVEDVYNNLLEWMIKHEEDLEAE